MNKIVSFFVVLATLVLTGCDKKWGGTDPVPQPEHNHYSLFGSGTAPAANPKLPDLPCNEVSLPRGTVSGVITDPNDNSQRVYRGKKVGRIFSLPFRNPELRNMTKKVIILVPEDEPLEVTRATLRRNGDCVEDYPSRPAR